MNKKVKELEVELDNFDIQTRISALKELLKIDNSEQENEKGLPAVNLHAHTFYSYNAYGYSPTHFAWLAKKRDLAVAGIIDFDVLDGLNEFVEVTHLLNLKYCVGIESRVFISELADKVINSPGDPGVSYHVGVGMVNAKPSGWSGEFLKRMQETAKERNEELITKVNAFLSPVEVSMKDDIEILTPSNNITERHICLAYARKAYQLHHSKFADFWSMKLGIEHSEIDAPEGAKLLDLIRAKTMKRGGVGYMQPSIDTFPALKDMNRFIIESGGIPAIAWLDGTTEGEQAIDELLEIEIKSGSAALNIIPARNFTPGVSDQKLKNLQQVIEKAEALGLPIVVGTEMNKDGNLFVDDFNSEELAPYNELFLKSAYIVYAHSVLQSQSGIGYLSQWAKTMFKDVFEKNQFFAELGERLSVEQEIKLQGVADLSPKEILNKL
jgi:hypothetical protein